MSYELRGQFLEVCDCYVLCPCWFEESPDEDECTGLVAWLVDQGQIGGVDVSGLASASLSYHTGHRESGHWQVRFYIDDRASSEQEKALFDAFSGALGGPLAELSRLTGKILGSDRARIQIKSDGKGTTLTIDRAIRARMSPVIGGTNRVTTVADGALSDVLGTPVEVGRSSQYRVDVPDREFDLRGRSATKGRFVYVRS